MGTHSVSKSNLEMYHTNNPCSYHVHWTESFRPGSQNSIYSWSCSACRTPHGARTFFDARHHDQQHTAGMIFSQNANTIRSRKRSTLIVDLDVVTNTRRIRWPMPDRHDTNPIQFKCNVGMHTKRPYSVPYSVFVFAFRFAMVCVDERNKNKAQKHTRTIYTCL